MTCELKAKITVLFILVFRLLDAGLVADELQKLVLVDLLDVELSRLRKLALASVLANNQIVQLFCYSTIYFRMFFILQLKQQQQ